MKIKTVMTSAKLLYFAVLLISSAILTSTVFAETVSRESITIKKTWARASIGTSRPAAAYMTIENMGDTPDVLMKIETPFAGVSEVHKTVMEDDISKMGPVGPLTIQAGSSIVLAPGGLHIMLMMLKKPLRKGESFPLILNFENAGLVELNVPIYGVGASEPK